MTDNPSLPDKLNRLSRDMLANGTVYKLATARDGAASTVLSMEELQASRRQFLADQHGDEDIWIFGYGSLIWNPLIDFEERRYGQLFGFHKRFCLWTRIGRGNPDAPGLVLALDRGGSVKGCVYRIRAERAAEELDILWRREMLNNSYLPRWLRVQTDRGMVNALAFTIRHDSPSFAPKMSDQETARHIARAEGFVGPCRDYLFETTQALREEGMPDRKMERLTALVKSHSEG
jgi:cation transport protein ChaC